MTEGWGMGNGEWRACRSYAVRHPEADRPAVSAPLRLAALFFLSVASCPLEAEQLVDPTRPPASLAAPAIVPAGEAVDSQPAGLQSIIISKTRRAAIIDGETVELGGKHGDAKLIEVNEGDIVLIGAQGRKTMTLFPGVKISATNSGKAAGDSKIRKMPLPPAVKARPARQEGEPAARKEKQ